MQTTRELRIWDRKVVMSGRAIEKWESETNTDRVRIHIDKASALHAVASNNWLLRIASAFVPYMPLFTFARFIPSQLSYPRCMLLRHRFSDGVLDI